MVLAEVETSLVQTDYLQELIGNFIILRTDFFTPNCILAGEEVQVITGIVNCKNLNGSGLDTSQMQPSLLIALAIDQNGQLKGIQPVPDSVKQASIINGRNDWDLRDRLASQLFTRSSG